MGRPILSNSNPESNLECVRESVRGCITLIAIKVQQMH